MKCLKWDQRHSDVKIVARNKRRRSDDFFCFIYNKTTHTAWWNEWQLWNMHVGIVWEFLSLMWFYNIQEQNNFNPLSLEVMKFNPSLIASPTRITLSSSSNSTITIEILLQIPSSWNLILFVCHHINRLLKVFLAKKIYFAIAQLYIFINWVLIEEFVEKKSFEVLPKRIFW